MYRKYLSGYYNGTFFLLIFIKHYQSKFIASSDLQKKKQKNTNSSKEFISVFCIHNQGWKIENLIWKIENLIWVKGYFSK